MAAPKEAQKIYKIVLFDLGNTVIRFNHMISAKKISARCSLKEDEIYDIFFDSDTTRLFDEGKISPEEFYNRVSRLLNLSIPYQEFVSIWSDIFWLDEESFGVVKDLKKTHRIFLISNINQLHFEYIMKRFDEMKIFDEFILSYVVGCLKPDIRIYEYAARLGNADFSELLYIDDRKDLVTQSSRLGIDSIRFENAPQLRSVLAAKGMLRHPES